MSLSPDSEPVTEAYRLRNALLWIRTIAGLHYWGGAFDPEHMRSLANLAADALDPAGRWLPDHEERMAEAQREASRLAEVFHLELRGDEEDSTPVKDPPE